MSRYYNLNKIPVLSYEDCSYGENEKCVGATHIGFLYISTVFLGYDHNWRSGDPHLFETMIFDNFDNDLVEYQVRCSTRKQAEAMHQDGLIAARKSIASEFLAYKSFL